MLEFLQSLLVLAFALYLTIGAVCGLMYVLRLGFTRDLPPNKRPFTQLVPLRERFIEMGVLFGLYVAWLPVLVIHRRRRLQQQTQH